MKKVFALLGILLTGLLLQAQNNTGIGTTAPAASAALDVTSTSQGMLVPRMTTAERIAITSPAKGLLVFDNTLNAFYYHNGTAWSEAGAPAGNARVDLVAKKLSAQQTLPTSTTSGDIAVYENIATAPTIGSYNNNAYTVGAAGLYLIQTRNAMATSSSGANNTVGAYNWVEVNGAAIGSYNNIYPSYIVNGSFYTSMPAALKSATTYVFVVSLNAGDVVKIRATGLNSASAQILDNNGGTQLIIAKL